MEEHIRKDGIYVIKPDEGQSGFSSEEIQWKMIDALIKDYAAVHKNEMSAILTDNKMIRETMKNEFGSGEAGGLRWGFRLPPGLVSIIDRRFPQFLVDRNNIHKFMERYPGFRVCETI